MLYIPSLLLLFYRNTSRLFDAFIPEDFQRFKRKKRELFYLFKFISRVYITCNAFCILMTVLSSLVMWCSAVLQKMTSTLRNGKSTE